MSIRHAYSPRDLAEHWGCSEADVMDLIHSGKLKAMRIARDVYRIPAARLDEFNASEVYKQTNYHFEPTTSIEAHFAEIYSGLSDLGPAETAARREHRHAPIVYFVKSGAFVKIGWTTRLWMRMGAIETNSPEKAELLLRIKGGLAVEARMHKKFAAHHHKREWFRYEGDLKAWIESKNAEAA